MDNLEHSIIRSRELKENRIKLSDIKISSDILVKSDTLIHIKDDDEENIVENSTVEPELLLEGLKNEQTTDIELPDSNFNLHYIENKQILDKTYRNNYNYFTETPYVEVDTNNELSIATLDINEVILLETDNILLDEPLVLKRENVSDFDKIKQDIESADEVYIYSENDKLKLELQTNKEYSFREAFKGETINILIFTLFAFSFIHTSIAITFIFIIGILSLYTEEFMKIRNGKTIKNRFFVDYGLDKNCKISDLFDIDEDKKYNLDISEEDSYFKLKSDELNAEWNIENNGILPDKFVKLFENIGFENISNKSLQLKITPKYQISDNKDYLISECGLWCIDTKQYITQKNKNSQKILQHN